MQLTQTEVDRLAESAERAGPARSRHGVHARRPLQAPALPGPDRGRRARRGAGPARGQLRPDAARRGARGPGIEIVLHAGRQDVAILRREWKTTFTNVFDTQVAAGFAGFSAQAGYNGLLHDVLRIRLPKTASFTRWDARPLTEEQVSLRPRRRRASAAAGRRHPGAPRRARPARVGARGVRRDRRGHRRARPRRGLAPAPARERARSARARRRAGDHGLARAHRGEGGPAGRRDPARPDRGRAGQAPAVRAPRPLPDPRHHARRRAPPRRRRDGGDRGRPAAEPIKLEEGDRSPTEAVDGPTIALAESLVRSRAQEAGLAYELIAARADLSPVVVAARRGQAEPEVRTLQGWRRELVGAELLELLAGRRTMGVDGRPRRGHRGLRPVEDGARGCRRGCRSPSRRRRR